MNQRQTSIGQSTTRRQVHKLLGVALTFLGLALLPPAAAFASGAGSHPVVGPTPTNGARAKSPALGTAAAGLVAAPTGRTGECRILDGSQVTTGNWAGYDTVGPGFTSVTATWTQPAVQPDRSVIADAAFWVGLDGAGGGDTVEQIGTEAYSDGKADAWFRLQPDEVVGIPLTIVAGDVITGTVTAMGLGYFSLSLADQTTGGSYTTGELYSGAAQRLSAEIMAEALTTPAGVRIPFLTSAQ